MYIYIYIFVIIIIYIYICVYACPIIIYIYVYIYIFLKKKTVWDKLTPKQSIVARNGKDQCGFPEPWKDAAWCNSRRLCIPGREHVQQPRSQFSITNASHQIKVFNMRERGFLKTGKQIACLSLMINPSKEPPLQFCGICPYWVPGLVNYHGKRTSHAPPRPEHVTVIHVDLLFISSNDILPEQKIEVWHEMCNPSLTTRIVHFGGPKVKINQWESWILHPDAPAPQLRKGHIAVTLLESSCACSNGHLWSSVVLAVSHILRLAAIQIMVLHVIQKNHPSPHEVPSTIGTPSREYIDQIHFPSWTFWGIIYTIAIIQ